MLAVAILLVSAAMTSAASAQTAKDSTFTESISVGYVMIPFVAADSKGRAIQNLRERDVQLLVGGRRVATDMFERATNAPVSFTILLDASGSMGLEGKMESAKAAIRALVAHGVKGDDYALYAFSSKGVHEIVSFTTEGRKVLAAVEKIVPWGKTAFYDALSIMPDRTILGSNGSRAIILLTDGLDNASTLTRQQLTRTLEGVDVPVYPLGLRLVSPPADQPVNPESMTDLETLAEIARVTGGRVNIGDEPETLAAAVDKIEQDLRSQYLIGFTPTGRGGVKYRPISVRVAGSQRVVRARAGYKGTEPPAFVTRREAARAEKSRKKGRSNG
jgi:Ca-activated chloride channel family protein